MSGRLKLLLLLGLAAVMAGGLWYSSKLVMEPLRTVNYASGPRCESSKDWRCFLTAQDKATLFASPLQFRLRVIDQNGAEVGKTNYIDTRQGNVGTQDFVDFQAENGTTYTCKIEVIDEEGIVHECTSISGRMICEGTTPTPGGPTSTTIPGVTSVVRTPTPAITVGTPCDRDDGDLNDDGNTDISDITLFGQYAFSGDSAARLQGDVNCDRKTNNQDLNLIIQRVVGVQ